MTSIRYQHERAQPGMRVIEHDGTEWTLEGTGRYAGRGGADGGWRTPGVSVRPIGGGRARVIAESRLAYIRSEET